MQPRPLPHHLASAIKESNGETRSKAKRSTNYCKPCALKVRLNLLYSMISALARLIQQLSRAAVALVLRGKHYSRLAAIEDIDANNDGIPDVYQDTRDGESGNTSGTADPPQR